MTTNDDAIIDLITPLRDKAKTYQGELSAERTKFYETYRAEPYGNERKGWSETVHHTVFSAVEWMKPGLFEVFTGDFFNFDPRIVDPGTVDQQREAADRLKRYVRFKLFSQLDGEQIIEDFIHDCLTSHYGIFKVTHKDDWDIVTAPAPAISAEQLPALEADPNFIELSGGEIVEGVDPLTLMPYSRIENATLVRRESIYSGFALEVVPGRELYMLPGHADLSKNPFVAHVVKRDLDYIKRQEMAGVYKPGSYARLREKIGSTEWDNPETGGEESTQYDVDGLTKPGEVDYAANGDHDAVSDNAPLMVWECYLRMKIDATGLLKPCIVTICEDVVLRDPVENPYKGPPFELGFVYREPHKAVGRPLAQILDHDQRVLTNLLRNVQDAAAMSTYRGFLTTDARTRKVLAGMGPGDVGLVPSIQQGSVMPLDPGSPNQFAFNALQLTLQEVAKETGVNENMQGLDNNSLNKTAAGMEMRMTAGMQRQRLYARRLARPFRRVLRRILDIIRLYPPQDDRESVGADVALMPNDIEGNYSIEINVGVGPQDRMNNAQMMDQIVQLQIQAGLQLGICEPKQIIRAIKAKYDYLDIDAGEFFFEEEQLDMLQQMQGQMQQLMSENQGLNQAIADHAAEMQGAVPPQPGQQGPPQMGMQPNG